MNHYSNRRLKSATWHFIRRKGYYSKSFSGHQKNSVKTKGGQQVGRLYLNKQYYSDRGWLMAMKGLSNRKHGGITSFLKEGTLAIMYNVSFLLFVKEISKILWRKVQSWCHHQKKFGNKDKTINTSLVITRLCLHYGRWNPDPSRISNKNYSTPPRGVMGAQRSEIKCRMQIYRFRAHLLTCLWVNDKNVYFRRTFFAIFGCL